MATVNDSESAWHGFTPVPRMVQNQVGHLFELRMIYLDRGVLPALQRMLERRGRPSWVVVAFVSVYPASRPGAWRRQKLFWGRYKDSLGSCAGYWRGKYADKSSTASGSILLDPPTSLKKRLHLVAPYCLIITAKWGKLLSLWIGTAKEQNIWLTMTR